MFKLIGTVIVYGFALYGVAKALERPNFWTQVTSKPEPCPPKESDHEVD